MMMMMMMIILVLFFNEISQSEDNHFKVFASASVANKDKVCDRTVINQIWCRDFFFL